MRETNVTQGREAAGQIILAVFCVALLVAIIRASYWSFEQTWDFMKVFDDPKSTDQTVSLAFAIIVQYGQNPALWGYFMLRKIKATLERQLESNKTSLLLRQKLESTVRGMWFLLFVFVVFAAIDSFTNIGQFNAEHPDLPAMLWITGNAFCIVVVFFEEGFTFTLNALFHIINDIRVIYGYSRWKTLDAFDPRAVLDTSSSTPQGDFPSRSSSYPQQRPTQKPISPVFGRKDDDDDEPTYHSIRK